MTSSTRARARGTAGRLLRASTLAARAGPSRHRPTVPLVVAVPALAVTAAALLPVGFVAAVTVATGWARLSALVFRPRVGELLVNTALLVALAVPVCAVLAVALAWLTERSDLPGARIWTWLAVAPLAVPAFVQGYAWASLAPGLNGLAAGVLVSVLAYGPLMVLPVAAALRRLDPALEDAAAALGQAPWQVFGRVVLPQLRLALCGGGLLIGLHLLAEYGLYVMLRFDTFTTAIVDQFKSTFAGPAANMLAGVLTLCCLVLLGLEGWIRGTERYARIGPGTPRARRKVRLGRASVPAVLLCGSVAAASIGVPLWTLGHWVLAGGWGAWRIDTIGPALGQTLMLAVVGGVLTTAAAAPMAWLSVRAPGPLSRALEACNYLVGSLPGVVVALGLVTVAIRLAPPIYQSVLNLLLAYGIMFLPRALVTVRASLAQAPVELEQVAGSLGRSPFGAMASVTLRLAAPGAAAGTVLASLGIANELAATQMLAPNGTRTLATAFWALSGELDYAAAAPYGVILVLVSLPLVVMLHAQSRRMSAR